MRGRFGSIWSSSRSGEWGWRIGWRRTPRAPSVVDRRLASPEWRGRCRLLALRKRFPPSSFGGSVANGFDSWRYNRLLLNAQSPLKPFFFFLRRNWHLLLCHPLSLSVTNKSVFFLIYVIDSMKIYTTHTSLFN